MAKKQYKIGLDTDLLNDLSRQIRSYRLELSMKSQKLVTKLAELGIRVINVTISTLPSEEASGTSGSLVGIQTEADGVVTAVYEMSGGKALFIEFSAGVTYGTPPGGYPLPSGAGMGVGTYPGQTHAYDPDGWYYKGDDGAVHHTYGNRAYMPVYHSTEAIALEVGRVASEVFG